MNTQTTPVHTTDLDLDLNKIKLNFTQCAILKMSAIGHSEIEIQKLLEINQTTYDKNFNELFEKYKTNNLFIIINLLLYNNQLSRYDFVKDNVKKISIKYSKSIFENIKSISYFNNKRTITSKILSHYIIDIHKSFINEASYNELVPLQIEDIEYLKLNLKNHQNLKQNFIMDELNSTQKNLITKFKANNYFNATRRVFELNLVNKSIFNTEYDSYNKKLQISTSQKIESIFYIDKYNEKERQLCIYFDLINYYNKLEDKLLFNTEYL